MSLYIGANYHPHDWTRERWKEDISLMKAAGFTTVRLGHLCWDSYEPEEGVYTFEWFDEVMDLFAEAGIGVVLDISMRPAPAWVHKLCPGCNIYGPAGTYQPSLRRYMEDIADPAYQQYALRFAEILIRRYRRHPALFAFGLCNEIGDGYLSHSEYARVRFGQWLKKKYNSVETLNQAWATKRWSRRINSFDEVVLQDNEIAIGAPEAWLDMRRFFADDIGEFLVKLKETVSVNAPGIHHSSNHFSGKIDLGFDYLKVCDRFVDYPGIGFYPAYDTGELYLAKSSEYLQRIAETDKPMWCLEFQTGARGIPFGPEGALRMQALLCLLNRGQMILGWTWRTMLAGEEQHHYGLLAHDGVPTRNYYEYKRIASDMKKLEQYGFPYLPIPDIGVAYNYDSIWVTEYTKDLFKVPYRKNIAKVRRTFYENNRDYNVVDLRGLKHSYKLLVVAGHCVMEPKAAQTIRKYVEEGGTVIMTGYSAVVDENGDVFGTPRPGYLDDVFGIRVAGFFRTDMPWTFSETSVMKEEGGQTRETLYVEKNEHAFAVNVDYYEILELRTAEHYAGYRGKDICAISRNSYGRGTAYYISAETDHVILGWLVEQLTEELGLKRGMEVPEGIQARQIGPDQYFYVNTTNHTVRIPLETAGRGVLSGKMLQGEMVLGKYDGELIIADTK